MKPEPMKKIAKSKGEMLPEYDFSRGVRGKYAKRNTKRSNVVVLDSAPKGRPSPSPGQRPGKKSIKKLKP
jgi:hypothetical protein